MKRLNPFGVAAYLGGRGSFSHQAARKLLPSLDEFAGYSSFNKIFEAVDKGKASLAVVPIKNSLVGPIEENIELMEKYELKIFHEDWLKVELKLLVPYLDESGLDLRKLKKIYSHPKALAQCAKFFQEHPWIEAVAYSDTARASSHVAKMNDIRYAAIGSSECARLNNLSIAQENLEDEEHNYTLFLALQKKSWRKP
ncbi:MAG: prephenate dehydratase [Chlamydiales bacterium]|jgi:prephenate dehydratase